MWVSRGSFAARPPGERHVYRMSKEKIKPCCHEMAEMAVSQVLGAGAGLPSPADPETGMFSPIHLYFRSIEWKNQQKIEQLLHNTEIECLVWTRVDINFCPFCGYDWRKYSLQALRALQYP